MKVTVPNFVAVDDVCIAYRWPAMGSTYNFALVKVGERQPRIVGGGTDLADANLGISQGSKRLGCSLTIVVTQPWPPSDVATKEVPRA